MSILFYDDSPVFGGHEVMSLLGLQAVLNQYPAPVHFLLSPANQKLCDQISDLASRYPNLTPVLLNEHSSKLEALRNRLKPSRIHSLAARFLQIKPSLVVAIQGNIEHSSLALHAARAAVIPSVSYIPVPHSNAEMGARFGKIRDLFAAHLFTLPDSFITITDEMARLLKHRGTTAPIHIVYNGVDTNRFHPGDAHAACSQMDLPHDKIRIGMIGRIEFRQKQQHLLIDAISSNPRLAQSCHLTFAGDGPDSLTLTNRIHQQGISGNILSWCDPALLYQSLHALVIPSRYEGLPLVMLEALSSGTPVLASNRDGMKDLLPTEWLFQPGSSSALASTIASFIANGLPRAPASLVEKVQNSMSLTAFQKSFSAAIFSHLQPTTLPN